MTTKTITFPILLAAFGALVLGTVVYANVARADTEEKTQAFEDKLNKAVERGHITQEQANKKREYYKSPEKSKEEYLQKAVEEGKITQEEADEIKNWMDSRPEAMEKLKSLKGKDPRGSFHKKGIYKK